MKIQRGYVPTRKSQGVTIGREIHDT